MDPGMKSLEKGGARMEFALTEKQRMLSDLVGEPSK
jgi:hypothetical protein